MDVLWEVADSLNLELSIPINPVSTQYVDNSQDINWIKIQKLLATEAIKFNRLLCNNLAKL